MEGAERVQQMKGAGERGIGKIGHVRRNMMMVTKHS